jgi:hypothetical protein
MIKGTFPSTLHTFPSQSHHHRYQYSRTPVGQPFVSNLPIWHTRLSSTSLRKRSICQVFLFTQKDWKITHIQDVPGRKDNILGGHSIGHSKQKLYMNMCPIPNGFRDRATLVVWLGRQVLSFPPALLREERSIFWEVIVSVILSKKLYMNMCPIPNGFRDRVIWLYSGLAWGPSVVHPSRPAVLCLKSNGSISETVQNRTHVHIKFFA